MPFKVIKVFVQLFIHLTIFEYMLSDEKSKVIQPFQQFFTYFDYIIKLENTVIKTFDKKHIFHGEIIQ